MGLVRGLRSRGYGKLPGDIDAAGSRTTLSARGGPKVSLLRELHVDVS